MAAQIDKLISDNILEKAYAWLVKVRSDAHHNNDVWLLIERWSQIKLTMQYEILNNKYIFEPVHSYSKDNKLYSIWSARDSLLLKALAMVLGEFLEHKLPKECTHIKGHGGLKQTVETVRNEYPNYKYALKSDIAGYYANINHKALTEELCRLSIDNNIIAPIIKSLKHIKINNTIYHEVE